MSKLCRTAACALAFLATGACVSHPASPSLAVEAIEAEAPTGWFCPMHPDVTADGPGTCSKCAMALIAGNPFDTREYLLDFRTTPPAVVPGVPFRAHFTIRHPGTEKPVTALELVHDRRYHLFVMSRDLDEFQHLHPELQPDGSWVMDVTVPKAGYYWLASDFVPTGGSPQFLSRPLITAGFTGDIMSEAAQLTPDAVMTRTVDGIIANVTTEPAIPVAGQYGHLMFALTDAASGQPVTDLQPYLGAFGHTLIVSEDLQDAVHSHPSPGPDSDVSRGRGGPRATFEGYLPRPGVYRAWTQFLRNDRLSTFTFTFRVWSLEDAVRIKSE